MCRFGFANGTVDDGAVSGNAIDGGELIIKCEEDDIELIPLAGGAIDVGFERSFDADNELIKCWLRVTGLVVMFGLCVVDVGALDGDGVAGAPDDDADADAHANGNGVGKSGNGDGCTRSISGLVMASNKNDNIENRLNLIDLNKHEKQKKNQLIDIYTRNERKREERVRKAEKSTILKVPTHNVRIMIIIIALCFNPNDSCGINAIKYNVW